MNGTESGVNSTQRSPPYMQSALLGVSDEVTTMASAQQTTPNESALPTDRDVTELLTTAKRAAVFPFEFVGFWLAVALPLLYLPLLVGGLTGAEVQAFIGLLALNCASLLLGRNYARDPEQ